MSKKDIIIKDYMRDKERFADAFNGYLYNGKEIIKADQLKIQDAIELGLLFRFLTLAHDKENLDQVKEDDKFADVSQETVKVMEICTDIKLKKVITERGGIDVCKAWEELKKDYLSEGEDRLATLIACLLNDGLNDIISKITEDIPLRESYYKKYGIK